MRGLFDRLRDWWHGPPGLHARRAIEQPSRHGSYVLRPPNTLPDPGAETDWPWAGEPPLPRAELEEAEQLLVHGVWRAMYPRLYWPAEDYWREQWTGFCIWAARQQAEATAYRREWGLADLELSTRPDLTSLRAVA